MHAIKTFPLIVTIALLCGCTQTSAPQAVASTQPSFNVLVITSHAKDHQKMMAAAAPMLTMMGTDNNFHVDITEDHSVINDANLARYQVYVQLQDAPFDMTADQQAALQKFIEQGGGWVGIHAAGLAGKQFIGSGAKYWSWFETFLGGVTYLPHPAFQQGTLVIEDHNHPITKNLPDKMVISDEWYEFNESPRRRVHVLAHADESTYKQNKPMGDHPMIWVNENYRRMVYIAIGHDASLCVNHDYQVLVRNAILWAATK
jgi:type 1 glutamine amidotransferase